MKSAAFHVNRPVFFSLPAALASILDPIDFYLAVFLLHEFAPAFLPISRIRPNLLWNDEHHIEVTQEWLDRLPRLRSLNYLVQSSYDSLLMERQGNEIRYLHTPIADTPWREDLAPLILTHFRAELLVLMPQGQWYLGVTPDLEVLAASR